MARRYENITINGIPFILDTKARGTVPVQMNIRSVDDCYSRCSDTKRAIWHDWSSWFYDNNGICTVSSYNCNFFTIDGVVTDKETDKRYRCYITRAYNRCEEIV